MVDMHIRYKQSALMNDRLIVETSISQLKPMSVTFTHTIKNKDSQNINITAETTIVSVDKSGKLIKRFPENIYNAFLNGLSK